MPISSLNCAATEKLPSAGNVNSTVNVFILVVTAIALFTKYGVQPPPPCPIANVIFPATDARASNETRYVFPATNAI